MGALPLRAGVGGDAPGRGPLADTWLEENHGRTIDHCTQRDADQYLASGPTTRQSIRTFFIWAKKSKINVAVKIGFR
jgi:hypothetical protein